MNMEQNVIQRNMWNTGAVGGAVLGAVSAAYLFLSHPLGSSEMPVFISMLASGVLWLAKFAGCIFLMGFFMKKFVSAYSNADNSATFRLGMIMAFTSALIFSAVSYADMTFISADRYAEQFDMIMPQMSSAMDTNTMNAMDRMIERLPEFTFFSNFIYRTLYGIVLAFILSRNIPRIDPFANYKPDEQ